MVRRKQKVEAIRVGDLVEAMERFGASFYFRAGGTLMVRNLGKLPHELVNLFMSCDGKQLVALVRSRTPANVAARGEQ